LQDLKTYKQATLEFPAKRHLTFVFWKIDADPCGKGRHFNEKKTCFMNNSIVFPCPVVDAVLKSFKIEALSACRLKRLHSSKLNWCMPELNLMAQVQSVQNNISRFTIHALV